MNPISKMNPPRISNPFLSGLVYSFMWLTGGAIALSIMLAFLGMKEQSLETYVYPAHGLAVALGGFVTGKRSGARGWYNGGMMGLAYGIIIALVSFLGFDAGFDLTLLWVLLIAFGAGAVGGIFGVNSRK